MAITETILLGYDGSADSQRAADWAAATARSRNAALRVVVATGSRQPLFKDQRRPEPEAAESIREKLEGQLAAVDGVRATVDVVAGGAAHAVLDAAQDAAMVVLGAGGHGALSGVLIGSVSQHVSRHAPCTVAVIRKPHDAEANAVVVGVDGSKDGEKALEFAFEMAQRERRPLAAVHAWSAITDSADLSAETEQATSEILKPWTENYPEVPMTLQAVPQAPPFALADASEQAAFVVVGSRGRGAFTGLLLGSVGQAVLQRAQCSVIIAR